MLVAVLNAAIVMAVAGADQSSPRASAQPVTHVVGAIEYTMAHRATDLDCVRNTVGDVQALLEEAGCVRMETTRFTATTGGEVAAISLSEIELASAEDAQALGELADQPGAGWAVDVAAQASRWHSGAPGFEGAARDSVVDGKRVLLAKAAWRTHPSDPDDQSLGAMASRAFDIQLNG
jgi:hypothetical protein